LKLKTFENRQEEPVTIEPPWHRVFPRTELCWECAFTDTKDAPASIPILLEDRGAKRCLQSKRRNSSFPYLYRDQYGYVTLQWPAMVVNVLAVWLLTSQSSTSAMLALYCPSSVTRSDCLGMARSGVCRACPSDCFGIA
jgi:hypothetical protein